MALVSDPPPPPPGRADQDPPPFAWYLPFVVGLSLYVVLGILVAAIAGVAGWHTLPDRFVLVATLAQDLLLILLAYVAARASGPRALFNLGVRRFRLSRALGYAALVFVGFLAFLIVWQQLLNIGEQDDLAQELGAKDSSVNLVAVGVLVCIVAPIAEELFFRGFMYGALRRSIGWIGAALITGVVFGIVHAGGTDAVFLVPLAVLGFLLCWLYRQTSSLLPGMAVHAFNNAWALGSTLGWAAGAQVTVVVLAPVLVVGLMSLVAVPQRPRFLPPVPPR